MKKMDTELLVVSDSATFLGVLGPYQGYLQYQGLPALGKFDEPAESGLETSTLMTVFPAELHQSNGIDLFTFEAVSLA